jgi:hypothetical protein
LYNLRILIEPFSANAGDLSEAALETHERLTTFLEEARLRLPNAQQPELPAAEPTPEAAPRLKPTKLTVPKQRAKEERDPNLDVEPNDIPF